MVSRCLDGQILLEDFLPPMHQNLQPNVSHGKIVCDPSRPACDIKILSPLQSK